MTAKLCPDCHHTPSGRTADYGAACHCRCHDVADASPDLLAALVKLCDASPVAAVLPPEDAKPFSEAYGVARAAIAKATE